MLNRVTLNRIKRVASYIRGDFIIVTVDRATEKLTVDAGNNSAEEVRKVANTLFRAAHNIG